MTTELIAPADHTGNPHTCSVPTAPTPSVLETLRSGLAHRRGKTWRKDLLKSLIDGTASPMNAQEAEAWGAWPKLATEGEPMFMGVYRYLMQKFAYLSFVVAIEGQHLRFDNYPTMGGEVVSVAELVLYPTTAFDGCFNRAEARKAKILRRKAQRGPYSGRRYRTHNIW